jgi:hypothetical protein
MTVTRSQILLVASAVALAACAESATTPVQQRNSPALHDLITVPVTDPTTGHVYQVVQQTPITWYTANDEANAMTYGNCLSAHLATITSASEDALIGNLGDEGGWWIGGRNFTTSPDPSFGWTWITGEPFSYANWRAGEPNNSNGNEFFRNEDALYVNLGSLGALFVDYPSGGSDLDGFVVEFEACTPTSQAQAVVDMVNSLVTTSTLPASDATAITTSLNQALASINKGNNTAAKGQLGSAVNKTNAAVNAGKISAAQGKQITDAMNKVIAGL